MDNSPPCVRRGHPTPLSLPPFSRFVNGSLPVKFELHFCRNVHLEWVQRCRIHVPDQNHPNRIEYHGFRVLVIALGIGSSFFWVPPKIDAFLLLLCLNYICCIHFFFKFHQISESTSRFFSSAIDIVLQNIPSVSMWHVPVSGRERCPGRSVRSLDPHPARVR